MAMKSSISDIDAQIEKLRECRRLKVVKSAERFAEAAKKSGLAELDISDGELGAIFEEIFRRFQQPSNDSPSSSSQSLRSSASASGTSAEVPQNG